MRELQVLGNGPLKLDLADCQEFFEQDLTEMVRSQLKLLIEQALCAERDHYPQLGYYEHAPVSRLDYRNGVYFRDLTTKLGVLAAHWKKVRTANLIERAFREVRRRARPMSNFCNTESCDRIVTASFRI
jgi:transposase-like protein